MPARLACAALLAAAPLLAQPAEWSSWSSQQAETIGQSTIARGRIAGGRRLLNTERAVSYKLAATWMTPEVIHAAARLMQLRGRLTDAQTAAAIEAALAVGDTVIMVELDPNEGSGVIPLEWEAFLQPKGLRDRAVRGEKAPQLRDIGALSGVAPRNYDYDRFWLIFPLSAADGTPLFRADDREAELLLRIYNREGGVTWRIPGSVRARAPRASAP